MKSIALAKKGYAERRLNRLDAALASLREATRLNPGIADAWNIIGLLLCDKRDYDGAIAAFEMAVKADPSRWAYYNNYGLALVEKPGGDLKQALDKFNKAVSLKRDSIVAWYNKGHVHKRTSSSAKLPAASSPR
jgi:tetratricopeptide (TPR) repeat protein